MWFSAFRGYQKSIASGGTQRHSELPISQGQRIQKEAYKKIGKMYLIIVLSFYVLVFSANFYREIELVKTTELLITNSIWSVKNRYLDLNSVSSSSSHGYISGIFFSIILFSFFVYYTIKDLFWFQLNSNVYDPITSKQKLVPFMCIGGSILLVYFWYIMDLNLDNTKYYGLKIMFMSPIYVILTPIYLSLVGFFFSGFVVWVFKLALQKWRFTDA